MTCVALAGVTSPAHSENWPHWRGPTHHGVSAETGLPVTWSESENVSWSLPLPDRSGSTPIVWGSRIFLSVADGDSLALWCVDKTSGELLWKRLLGGGNESKRKHNMSSPSPVTDGEAVWVLTGTGVLKGFDFDGREQWSRDFQSEYGAFGLNWGYGSSPLLLGDSVYVQVLHGMNTDDPSYLLRVDKRTGENRWRHIRPTAAIRESPDSYTTPAVLQHGGREQLVVTGGDCVTGHELESGGELWRFCGLNPGNSPYNRIVASPVIEGEMVYAPSRVKPLVALQAGGRGELGADRVVWSFDAGPDVPTPVSDGEYLYVVSDKGIVSCLDAMTGAVVYEKQRLAPGTYSSSPVLADGRIYATSEDGVTSVFRAGSKFESLAENALPGFALSSPAISDGQIFLRTDQALYCVGQRAAN